MKFYGIIGFLEEEAEVCPGVWKPVIVEKPYIGEVLRNTRRLQISDKQNGDLTTTNQISILSDLYARKNWQTILYVIWNGVKWIVSEVEVLYPRLKLSLGGVYNENER